MTDFHKKLSAYLNGQEPSVVGYIGVWLCPRCFFHFRARDLRRAREGLVMPSVEGADEEIPIAAYEGDNPHVRAMQDYLNRHLREDLIGAYVHGSLGTGEEVAYSDFDALVILKDEVFMSTRRLARVALRLYRARRIMKAFDPLQHHGWFVLTEAQLQAYPEVYFPRVLFRHARSLLPGGGRLRIRGEMNRSEAVRAFRNLSDNVARRLELRQYPDSVYELKFLLSQVMLLPALYVQARDGKGVFKKYSFDRARPDFEAGDWAVMDEVSAIRADWHYDLNAWQRWWLTRLSRPAARLARRFAPAIPADLRGRLDAVFYERIVRLVRLMQARVAEPGEAGGASALPGASRTGNDHHYSD